MKSLRKFLFPLIIAIAALSLVTACSFNSEKNDNNQTQPPYSEETENNQGTDGDETENGVNDSENGTNGSEEGNDSDKGNTETGSSDSENSGNQSPDEGTEDIWSGVHRP